MVPHRLYLTLHGLGDPPTANADEERPYWLSTALFERTLDCAAALACHNNIEICFTFDDGKLSDYSLALPRLVSRGKSATFFVCGALIEQPGFLDRGQLREMAAAGMTIGCHGHNHVNWRRLSDACLARELSLGRRAVEDAIGQRVDQASVPFGELDRRVVRAVADAGFRCLFTSSGGVAIAATGLIPRNTLKATFKPETELQAMLMLHRRLWTGTIDAARRLKHGLY